MTCYLWWCDEYISGSREQLEPGNTSGGCFWFTTMNSHQSICTFSKHSLTPSLFLSLHLSTSQLPFHQFICPYLFCSVCLSIIPDFFTPSPISFSFFFPCYRSLALVSSPHLYQLDALIEMSPYRKPSEFKPNQLRGICLLMDSHALADTHPHPHPHTLTGQCIPH